MIPKSFDTCNSRILVDWLSLTVGLSYSSAITDKASLNGALLKTWLRLFAEDGELQPQPGPGRAGYHLSMTDERNRVTLYGRISDPDALLEISGRGCEYLREVNALSIVLWKAKYTGTRLDIAIDFETDVLPADFASTCQNPRIKTRSSITSPTGLTEYLGSRKSDRYCRIYRYAPPHPRSKYLRLEMVMRTGLAREAIKGIIETGLQESADRCAATYKFSHPIYQDLGAAPITDYRPETEMSKTLRWFHVQVVPAVRKLVDAEALTWEEIFNAICDSRSR